MKKTMENTMENINVTFTTDKAMRAEMIVNTTPELGGRRIAVLPLDLCDVDYSYQRVRTSHVNYLHDNFDINECDPLLVSYRNGRFYIIDGQHRYYAALSRGVKNLLCIIRTGLTMEDEARIFVKTNRARKPLKVFDIFKANIANGNEDIPEVKVDMGVKRVCDKHNVKISYHNDLSAPRKIRALTSVRDIVGIYGEDALDWIFETMKETNWYECPLSYNDNILCALKVYYGNNINDLDRAKANLIKLMTEHSPSDLIIYGDEKYARHGYGRKLRLTNALKDLA